MEKSIDQAYTDLQSNCCDNSLPPWQIATLASSPACQRSSGFSSGASRKDLVRSLTTKNSAICFTEVAKNARRNKDELNNANTLGMGKEND